MEGRFKKRAKGEEKEIGWELICERAVFRLGGEHDICIAIGLKKPTPEQLVEMEDRFNVKYLYFLKPRSLPEEYSDRIVVHNLLALELAKIAHDFTHRKIYLWIEEAALMLWLFNQLKTNKLEGEGLLPVLRHVESFLVYTDKYFWEEKL